MTATRTLIKAESSSAEHFGAINETFVFRLVWADPTETPSPRAAVASLINQGLEGIAARPGRELVLDSTLVRAGLTTRTVDAQCNDAGGLDVIVGCTRYNWGESGVGDPAIRMMVTPTTQTVQAWRANPIVPDLSGTGLSEFDSDDWAKADSVAGTGLNEEAGSAPTEAAPDDGTYRPAGDIGGTPIDWNGNPQNILIPIMRVEIDFMRRGGSINTSGTFTEDALPFSVLTNYLGKRNSLPFLGFATGSLLFDGLNRSRLDGEWTMCTASFLWHPWRHAIQVPRPTFGTKAGTLKYEEDPRNIQHTRSVYWMQPYLQGKDFNTVTTAGDPGLWTTLELVSLKGFAGVI